MENSKREIESFLYLYPSAIKYYDSIKYNQQKVYLEILYLIFNYPHKYYTFKYFKV